ncbi:MAG: hypothetical protein ACRD5H_00690 [Nitrososphaerales archaeon]
MHIELGKTGWIISISDAADVYLLSFLASVPAIYAGLFLLKLVKPTARRESTKALAASIGVGILLASFYDLTKETAGISTGVLRSVEEAFNVITFSAVLLGFIALYAYTKRRDSANNVNDNDNPSAVVGTSINNLKTATTVPLVLTYAWAILGVGLHSMGEGIIMGYDFSTGATSLSPSQISSFVLHKIGEGFTIGVLTMYNHNNTTSKNRHLLATGAIAAVPTMAGAAMGYALFPSILSTYLFAAAAGATIFIITIFVTLMASPRYSVPIGILVGFLFMYFSGVLHQFE